MEKCQRISKQHQEEKEPSHKHNLFLCADIILPWLYPSELASISSTCKTLYGISKSITTVRCSDAARNFEKLPIPFFNSVDHQPYAFFMYTPRQIPAYLLVRQQWGSLRSSPAIRARGTSNSSSRHSRLINEDVEYGCGCDCSTVCGTEVEDEEFRCPCSALRSYEVMAECGPSCRCGLECGNRLTQRGVSVRLKIIKDLKKGWGLYADQLIHQGQFVCEYAGEVLTTTEARRRQQFYDEQASSGRFSSALLVVREHLPSGKACLRMNIDATRVGNVARFINHSCDGGNLSTMLVRCSGALLPRLCFFASRDIPENEELSFSYGDTRLRPKGLECFCGSSDCFGVLPSELT